ncbi:DUF6301 family protein [Actinomyces sp. 432]|uniref:DUF6301 family protein n=1 Tax=Actinomyces sp. 432 TaxID=2057798 RepID=UPI00137A530B|nr:DUF6301 family protein [Actinomyces sp. 432]
MSTTDPGTAAGDTTASIDPNHHGDAPSHGMRILPVERAVEWIRAWAELDWPITWETAYATRDKLGWTPAPDDGRFFTTELSTNGQEDGSISQLDGDVSGLTIPLTSLVPKTQRDQTTAPTTWAAYNAYVEQVTQIYGQGTHETGRLGSEQTKWTLPNGAGLNVIASPGLIEAKVKSPSLTKINAQELYYVEKYGEDYVDD